VRHSSDFGVGWWGRAFGEVAGGINYQCIHHLLPGVSHVHFPALTEILEHTCAEFNVPYVRHASLAAALWSVAKTFAVTMQPAEQSPQAVEVVPTEMAMAQVVPDVRVVDIQYHSRQRGVDGITGALFGAWLALGSFAIARKGTHLLAVPICLILVLFFHYSMGSFELARDDEKFSAMRRRRSTALMKSSSNVSTFFWTWECSSSC